MKRRTIFLPILMLMAMTLLNCSAGNEQKTSHPDFMDTSQDFDTRIDLLLSQLTLHEKCQLLLYNSPAIERLEIPEYNWWNECLHGVGRAGKATVFPQAIGLAATFDEDLVYQIANAIADEARAKHHEALRKNSRIQYTGLTFWTPNINIFRDPRWGRGQETYGEDVFLTSRIGVSFVKGLQGNHPRYLKASACAKHFAVHSGPEKSRHEFNALPDERDLREIYLPAFRALVQAGVESVMCAYNRLNDEPCCGSPFLLQDILRNEWGFKGHIVSDCWALWDFVNGHKIVKTPVEAAVIAANAGVNVNCGTVYQHLKHAVDSGLVSENQIDKLLRPVLMTRFKLGMFDPHEMNPYALVPATVVNNDSNIKLAYTSALKSMVLLKNKNNVLPVLKENLKKIVVTGPVASNIEALLGNYNGFSGNMVTILEGFMSKIDAATVLQYSPGCLLMGENLFHGIGNAVDADLVVAAMGINHLLEGEDGDALLNKNGGDRLDLKLPENQLEFLRQMRKAIGEKPLVVIVTGGSAVDLSEISQLADALIFAWYPGEQGGNAIADLVFGNSNPSGKLPVTFYSSVNELPPFDNYSMEGRTYRYYRGKALYPFGYGLSYSKFGLEKQVLNQEKFRMGEKMVYSCKIKNSGNYDGEEVVQVYARKIDPVMLKANKILIGFKRIFVEKGGSKNLQIDMDINQLQYWDVQKKQYTTERGNYLVEIGFSSQDIVWQKEINIEP
jgi:beta-glucosidase